MQNIVQIVSFDQFIGQFLGATLLGHCTGLLCQVRIWEYKNTNSWCVKYHTSQIFISCSSLISYFSTNDLICRFVCSQFCFLVQTFISPAVDWTPMHYSFCLELTKNCFPSNLRQSSCSQAVFVCVMEARASVWMLFFSSKAQTQQLWCSRPGRMGA